MASYAIATIAVLCLLVWQSSRAAQPVRVFAAASLTSALERVSADYEAATGTRVLASFAASSTLAKQIENGAPADIFFSADTKWMDYLVRKNLVLADSRRDLLGNALVLVAPAGKTFTAELKPGFDLPAAFTGRLCTGDPDSVPAGIYAKEALLRLGWWDAFAGRLAGTEDVRSALRFVERGECAAGIVYATDALASAKVEVVARFPDGTHTPIVYPVALVKGHAAGAAGEFLRYLAAPASRAVFEALGFAVLP